MIFGYFSDYIRCASNVLKCLGRYPIITDLKRSSLGRTEISEYTPTPNDRSSYNLVPIFVLAGGVNALAGVLLYFNHTCKALSIISSCGKRHTNCQIIIIIIIVIIIIIITQLVERRSRNPKTRVRIPLETTNFSLFSAVSDRLGLAYVPLRQGNDLEFLNSSGKRVNNSSCSLQNTVKPTPKTFRTAKNFKAPLSARMAMPLNWGQSESVRFI